MEHEQTYRLSLSDNSNRSVQIEVDIKSLGKYLKDILDAYEDLLKAEQEIKEAVENKDIALTEQLIKEQEEKQSQLPSHTCPQCNLSWKGGVPVCKNAGRSTGANKRPPCPNFNQPI